MNNALTQLSLYKILSFYSEAQSILDGKIPPPRMVSFWPTTVCNFDCDFCLFRRENSKEHVVADTRKTIAFLDDIKEFGVKSFEMSGGGEPTVHPDFDIIAREAVVRDLKVGLFTNGTRLDYHTMKDFKYVRVGLDAIDADSHAKIKRPKSADAFNTVINNICRFTNEKQFVDRPRLGIKFLINKTNLSQMEQMVELAADLGANYVHFKPEHNGPHSLSLYQKRGCAALLSAVKEKTKRDIEIMGSFSPASSKGGKWTFKSGCLLSPIHAVVDPMGNVFVCCYTRKKIGNIFNAKVDTFWGKKEHQNIIHNIDVKSCAKWDCRWKDYNRFMRQIIIEDAADIDFI